MHSTITILDGGMGRELARMGAPFRQPEWSALALLEDPDSVVSAHRSFVEAGAQVITTNAYAVVPFHLGEERFEARGRELVDLAGRLARQAAKEASEPVRVAGSIPPLFGSYEPERFEPARAPALFEVLIEAQAPWVDLWLIETIGSVAEVAAAGVALDRAQAAGERWYALSLSDVDVHPDTGRPLLWSKESVADAVQAAVAGGASALLLNCSTPEDVSAALPEVTDTLAAAGSTIPVGAYANAFQRPNSRAANTSIWGRREELTPTVYGDQVAEWVELGASIVGGCCSIYPEHIAELRSRFGPPAG